MFVSSVGLSLPIHWSVGLPPPRHCSAHARIADVTSSSVRLPISGYSTFGLPPDNQWPRVLLSAWPPYQTAPAPGTLVYVRGSRGGGVARVVAVEDEQLTVSPMFGPKAGALVCAPRRKVEIMRGREAERHALLMCGETETFRQLARSQLLPGDRVLEIGCSYGEATSLITRRAGTVLAVDVSSDAIKRAAARCAANTNVRFEKLDAIKDPSQLLDLASRADTNVIFVDVNGNRASDAVAPLLSALAENIAPQLLVVKNRELSDAARAHQEASELRECDPALLPDSARFWHTILPSGAMSQRERHWRAPPQWRSRAGSFARLRDASARRHHAQATAQKPVG